MSGANVTSVNTDPKVCLAMATFCAIGNLSPERLFFALLCQGCMDSVAAIRGEEIVEFNAENKGCSVSHLCLFEVYNHRWCGLASVSSTMSGINVTSVNSDPKVCLAMTSFCGAGNLSPKRLILHYCAKVTWILLLPFEVRNLPSSMQRTKDALQAISFFEVCNRSAWEHHDGAFLQVFPPQCLTQMLLP